ncbi:methyltransferase domain-containing protein [candidate division KSB1 bacterium]|nr:methyltransferase domain-containing protein [candidate division KSB1 bacterium]
MNNLDFLKKIRPVGYFKNDYLYACYIALYQFAIDYCKNKKVLDAACGMGFGSYYLKQQAAEVVGIDISDHALEHARQQYSADGLAFEKIDATHMPFPDQSFDVIVSIETYEHIPPELAVRFLAEAKRILKPGGCLIISTPNSPVYSKISKTPDHINEVDVDTFDISLATYFPDREFYYQRKNVLQEMKAFYSVIRSDRFKLRELIPNSWKQAVKKRIAKNITMEMDALLTKLKVHQASSKYDVEDAVIQVVVCRM